MLQIRTERLQGERGKMTCLPGPSSCGRLAEVTLVHVLWEVG